MEELVGLINTKTRLKYIEKQKKRSNIDEAIKVMKVMNRRDNTGTKLATKRDKKIINEISSINYYGCSDNFILEHMQEILCSLMLYLDLDTSSVIYKFLSPTILTRDNLIFEINHLMKTKLKFKYMIYISPNKIKILRAFDNIAVIFDKYHLIIYTHTYNLICFQLVCSKGVNQRKKIYNIEPYMFIKFDINKDLRFYHMNADGEKYYITIGI